MKTFRFLTSHGVAQQLCIYALVLEPVRFLTAWALSRSKDFVDPCRHPPLLDLVSDFANPGVAALQYLASLLDGSSPRLRMLEALCECRSFEEFHDCSAEWSARLRTAVLLVMAWVYRRWILKFRTWEYKLASLADQRVSRSQRRQVAEQFEKDSPCGYCIGRFGRGIQTALVEARGPSNFEHPLWVQTMWLWARAMSFCVSIADLERKTAAARPSQRRLQCNGRLSCLHM